MFLKRAVDCDNVSSGPYKPYKKIKLKLFVCFNAFYGDSLCKTLKHNNWSRGLKQTKNERKS